MKPHILIPLLLLLFPLAAEENENEVLQTFNKGQQRLRARRDLDRLRLGSHYKKAVERLADQARQNGVLDRKILLEEEILRFQEADGIETPVSEPEALSRLQITYRREETLILRRYHTGIRRLHEQVDRKLALLEKEKVRADRVDDAVEIRRIRDQTRGAPGITKAITWLREHPAPDPKAPEGALEPAFLSELPVREHSVGWGDIGLGSDLGWEKQIIQVGKKKVKHGIAIHPPSEGNSFAEFQLEKPYQTLRGQVALNNTGKKLIRGIMRFRIVGDGKLLWESKDFKLGAKPEPFEVPVRGVKILRLEIHCPGENSYSHGVFVDPVLR